MKMTIVWAGGAALGLAAAAAFGEAAAGPGAKALARDRARQAQIERNREAHEAKKTALAKQRAEWEQKKAAMEKERAEREQKKAEEKACAEAERLRLEKGALARVEQRQDNQAKRIQHGIARGFLTPEETARLRSQQQAIEQMEQQFMGDGRLSRDEFAKLRAALNDASRMIWAEKHDGEGRTMPVYRLGKNVFALDALTAKLNDPDLPRAEARALLADFRELLRLRDRLANEDLPDAEREKLQAAYDALLNAYFRLS